jgi:hypothetical protein
MAVSMLLQTAAGDSDALTAQHWNSCTHSAVVGQTLQGPASHLTPVAISVLGSVRSGVSLMPSHECICCTSKMASCASVRCEHCGSFDMCTQPGTAVHSKPPVQAESSSSSV